MDDLKSKIEELKNRVDKEVLESEDHLHTENLVELIKELNKLVDEYIGVTACTCTGKCEGN